jgi:hypothetical protein
MAFVAWSDCENGRRRSSLVAPPKDHGRVAGLARHLAALDPDVVQLLEDVLDGVLVRIGRARLHWHVDLALERRDATRHVGPRDLLSGAQTAKVHAANVVGPFRRVLGHLVVCCEYLALDDAETLQYGTNRGPAVG